MCIGKIMPLPLAGTRICVTEIWWSSLHLFEWTRGKCCWNNKTVKGSWFDRRLPYPPAFDNLFSHKTLYNGWDEAQNWTTAAQTLADLHQGIDYFSIFPSCDILQPGVHLHRINRALSQDHSLDHSGIGKASSYTVVYITFYATF